VSEPRRIRIIGAKQSLFWRFAMIFISILASSSPSRRMCAIESGQSRNFALYRCQFGPPMKTERKRMPGRDAGVAPPFIDVSLTKFAAAGVDFSLSFLGERRAFFMSAETLARLGGTAVGPKGIEEVFTRNQSRIVGIASRALRAGAVGNPLVLTEMNFTSAATMQ
jgi:hypothetical protein